MGTRGDGVGTDDRVHVRYLDVFDTFRWSWEVLSGRVELVGVAFAVGLLSVVSSVGLSQSSPTATPEYADWVWAVSLAYFVGLAIAWGVVYRTAGHAVADDSRPLTDRLVAAAKRIPALFGVAVTTWVVTVAGIVAFVVPGVYLFHRLVLAYPACVIDQKGPLGSLRAGWRASSGRALKVFASSLVYAVLLVVTNVLAGLAGGIDTLAATAVGLALSAGSVPLYGLALAHLYLEESRNQ